MFIRKYNSILIFLINFLFLFLTLIFKNWFEFGIYKQKEQVSYTTYQFWIKSLLCFPWLIFFLRTQTLIWYILKSEKVFSYSFIKSFFCSQKCEFLFSEPVRFAAATLLLLVYKLETSEQVACAEWMNVFGSPFPWAMTRLYLWPLYLPQGRLTLWVDSLRQRPKIESASTSDITKPGYSKNQGMHWLSQFLIWRRVLGTLTQVSPY